MSYIVEEYLDRYVDDKHVFYTVTDLKTFENLVIVGKLMEKSNIIYPEDVRNIKFCRCECDKVTVVDIIGKVKKGITKHSQYNHRGVYKIDDIYEPEDMFVMCKHYGPIIGTLPYFYPNSADGRHICWANNGQMTMKYNPNDNFYELWDNKGNRECSFTRFGLIYEKEYRQYHMNSRLFYILYYEKNIVNWKKSIWLTITNNTTIQKVILSFFSWFAYKTIRSIFS